MKLTIKLTAEEMKELNNSVHGIAPVLDAEDSVPELFKAERDIDLKSIKFCQRTGDIEIDIDPEFACWFIENYFNLLKAIMIPYKEYMEKMMNEADRWITLDN